MKSVVQSFWSRSKSLHAPVHERVCVLDCFLFCFHGKEIACHATEARPNTASQDKNVADAGLKLRNKPLALDAVHTKVQPAKQTYTAADRCRLELFRMPEM